jgi:hypothetical protein
MSPLAALQRALADVIRRPDSLVDQADAVASADGIAAGNDRLSPVEQVDIYREQFFLRHVDCLRDDFASLEHLLGEEGFEALCRAYLAARPSASFTLRDLGNAVTSFVATEPPWRDDPLLADLARVEWAFVEAFDGPDAAPFDPASVAAASEDAWPRARIVFHPSLQRLTLRYPAHDYRIAARSKDDGVRDSVARPEPKGTHIVVYRGPDALHAYHLAGDAHAMIEELVRGVPLGEACERAAAASGIALDAFQSKLGGWFQEWTTRRWITRVDFGFG